MATRGCTPATLSSTTVTSSPQHTRRWWCAPRYRLGGVLSWQLEPAVLPSSYTAVFCLLQPLACRTAATCSSKQQFMLYTEPRMKSSSFRLSCRVLASNNAADVTAVPATQRQPHSWVDCPFAHIGEKAKRRDLRFFTYTPELCQDAKRNVECPRGDACGKSHHVRGCYCAAVVAVLTAQSGFLQVVHYNCCQLLHALLSCKLQLL